MFYRFVLAHCPEDPGLGICNKNREEPSLELKGGTKSEGNLFISGQPICDDMWDEKDATVTCRMLGYSFNTCLVLKVIFNHEEYQSRFYYGQATIDSKYGSVPNDFLLNDVQCDGSEMSIFDCPSTSDTSDCASHEGAGVICSGNGKVSVFDQRS